VAGIRVLAPHIVQRISAGEVIDSPKAVLRELIENALDAQADRLTIDLWTRDDLFSLQVTDNGIGMTPADLRLATTPHSTSKISQLEDLATISSLGFRGEALHSIAQFAPLTIASRSGEDPGYLLNGGELTPCALAPGTIVKAIDLFAQFPQRRRGLPDRSQQLRQIQRLIQDFALLYPSLTWGVNLEHSPWFQIWYSPNIKGIALQFLSHLSETDLIEDQQQYGTILLGLPGRVSRPRSDWIKIGINGRMVNIPELEQSILAGFSRTLPRHRFPLCVVNLKIDRAEIDWQRHPAKTEIYLTNLQKWQTKIEEWIKQLLKSPQPTLSSHGKNLLKLAESKIIYKTQSLKPIKVLGQLHDTYIIIEQEEGIYLIEQHVAHERVLFEKLEILWEIIPLPEPILVSNLKDEQIENLNRSGIVTEPFGNNICRISALPRLLVDHPDPLSAIYELAQEQTDRDLRARVACISAIRNGKALDSQTMNQIVQDWQTLQNPHTCPHGRPIYFFLGKQQLARFFRRP
jgi:DNA mismatch repair protein MutL